MSLSILVGLCSLFPAGSSVTIPGSVFSTISCRVPSSVNVLIPRAPIVCQCISLILPCTAGHLDLCVGVIDQKVSLQADLFFRKMMQEVH
ncbi:hypothetical protein AMECASPLE_031231 [Ameca splendens]|uniref:Secreted protein n=1 Tax=Ameca splendens TaxID=208324 RepID=A0ABV0YIF4_9TELE